jgi:AAA domain
MTQDSQISSEKDLEFPPAVKTQAAKPASWLNLIRADVGHKPPRMMIVGGAGVGKTSFGASLPKPILIDWDHGADESPVKTIPGPNSWPDSLALIRDIANKPSGYQSLVIDTIDPLETLCEKFISARDKKKDICDYDFGAGYHALAAEWRVLLAEFDAVRNAGLVVCILAHVITRQINDPSLGAYDQYGSQLQKKTWAETMQWCDLVGFATFDAVRVPGDEKRAIVTSQKRLLYTSRGSGFDAKNRFSMPHKMELSWPEVSDAIDKHRVSVSALKAKILAVAKGTKFEAKAAEYIAQAGDDKSALLEIEKALKEGLSK